MTRSEIMRRVKSKNTGPERRLKRLVRRLGFQYKAHPRLPAGAKKHYTADALVGVPLVSYALVVPRSIAVFVHGCFWHGHTLCYQPPKTNRFFWEDKVVKNVARDKRAAEAARRAGYTVVTLWECEPEAAWERKLKAGAVRAGTLL